MFMRGKILLLKIIIFNFIKRKSLFIFYIESKRLNDKSYSVFSKQMQNYSVKNQNLLNLDTNKSPIRKYITPNLTPINRNINNNNNIIKDKNFNVNDNNNSNNVSKSTEKASHKSQSNLPFKTDGEFSNLLALVTNANQMNNANNSINIDNNRFKSAKNMNVNNNINDLNLNLNNMQIKESSRSLNKNIFNEKIKVNSSNEEGKTMVMAKDSEVLLPSTLNNIFNENKAEEIKEQIYKTKKKEIFRKVLSFGKKAAELFTNEKYTVIFVDKKEEIVELDNKSIIISKPLIKNNEIFIENKSFLENIPDMSFEEDSVNHFNEKNLKKEEVISFTFESIYQNINTITNMKYSKNRIYQEKTIKFLKKLESKPNTSISSKDNKNSFSNSLSDNDNSVSIYSPSKKNSKETSNISVKSPKKLDLLKLFSDSFDSKEESNIKFGQIVNKTKHRQKNKKKDKKIEEQKFTVGNSVFSRGDLGTNSNIHEYQSLKPIHAINLESPKIHSVKRSRGSKNFKRNSNITFKNDTINDYNNSINEKLGSPFSKKKRFSNLEKGKSKRPSEQKSSIFAGLESSNNIKASKTAKKNFLRFEIDNNKIAIYLKISQTLMKDIQKQVHILLKASKN